MRNIRNDQMSRPISLYSHECHKSVKNTALTAAFYTTTCATVVISAFTRVFARHSWSGIITEPQQAIFL